MQVAVRFGRETGLDTAVVLTFRKIFFYDLLNKIETFFLLFHMSVVTIYIEFPINRVLITY